MPFYETVPLFPEERKQAETKTESQNNLVFKCFEKLKVPMGASLVYKYLLNTGKITHRVPITSIRRSISNLTKEGLLRKTSGTVKGSYGMREHLWTINILHRHD